MTLRQRLEALVAAAPPGTMVPVESFREWLAAEADDRTLPIGNGDPVVDLTVAHLASRFGKGESTIRTWLARGDFPGAYLNHGKEWRVPPSSLAAMQSEQAKQHRTPSPRARSSRRTADISEWRKHLPKAS